MQRRVPVRPSTSFYHSELLDINPAHVAHIAIQGIKGRLTYAFAI
jgi:hypothetical protein